MINGRPPAIQRGIAGNDKRNDFRHTIDQRRHSGMTFDTVADAVSHCGLHRPKKWRHDCDQYAFYLCGL